MMERALAAARQAAARGEVPVGAVLLAPNGAVLACAGNQVEADRDASAHAELLVLRTAARHLGIPRLPGCDLFVTLEPCPMCAAALVHFRVRRLVFGAYDPKGGGVDHGPRIFDAPTCLHRPEVIGGVREAECSALLHGFFANLRTDATASLSLRERAGVRGSWSGTHTAAQHAPAMPGAGAVRPPHPGPLPEGEG